MNLFCEIKRIVSFGLKLSIFELKLKNEGKYIGFFWYLLDPLIMFLLLYLTRVFFIGTDFLQYPAYLMLGILLFNFFSRSTSQSLSSIRSNAQIVKSIRFPKESLILSKVFLNSFVHFIELFLFIIILIYFQLQFFNVIYYLFIFLIYFIFTLGISFLLSVYGTFINDFPNIWSVFLRMLWLVTPIFYVIDTIPIGKIIKLNILNNFLELARNIVIFNKYPTALDLMVIVFFSLNVFIIGYIVFIKNKESLVEII